MEQYLGQIELFAFGFAPSGWMLCNGASLNVQQYSDLYFFLGTTYGGDGKTSFCIPNLLGTEPAANMNYYIAVLGDYLDS